jgi:hypothetical protein
MFRKKILFFLLVLVIGASLNTNAQNKNVPATLRAVTWKIDQLYLDTLPVFNESLDSVRYRFDDNGMVTLSATGFPGITQPYTYKTGNKGTSELTILFRSIPAETYQVVKLSAHTFIFTINKMTSSGTNGRLEYRLVPE